MQREIRKWGNSLALRIPKAVAQQISIKERDIVRIKVQDNKITIEPIKSGQTLNELLKCITPDNLHSEIEANGPVGNEIW
ncbi:MAG: AbrB/MazE/SpoVT family DNA-binding domain-containing protein [Epsilonproteobacteria bacterium]|nr:AbrB/MazE/SpoVT family DNA-binding domain-containing protein [Campylobacterota bacterium]